MKASELRIGNYYNEFGIPKIADPNLILKLYQIEIAGKITIDITPIPLTEEWLLKFGFTVGRLKNCYFKDWGTNGVECVVCEYHYKGGFEYELGNNRYKVIEYIHQLQNLYFALTGNELIIK